MGGKKKTQCVLRLAKRRQESMKNQQKKRNAIFGDVNSLLLQTNSVAEYDSLNPLERYYQQRKMSFICKFVQEIMRKKPGILLDLGCGEGVFFDFAKEVSEKTLTVGLDIGRKNCASIQQKKHNAICGDVNSLPLQTNSVELVLLLDVIEHLYENDILSDINRVLKNEGDLLLTTPNKFGIYEHKQLVYGENLCHNPLDVFNSLMGKPRSYAPYHVRLYTYKAIVRALQDHGFVILESTTEGFCFPFLGTMQNIFFVFKKESFFRYLFNKRIIKLLEAFERNLKLFNFLIIVHARKNPKECLI
jgi:ubiquinone/menaquinone biosynthesis C-methylase UbiE